MENFKEWLMLDHFKTDVILPIYRSLTAEVILEEFVRQFLEATEDSYYKDSEIDCQKCKYHGRFENLGSLNLRCPKCDDVVSDREISECEYCDYIGRFDEKDDANYCPKCGKKEVVELDDPFSGDEDATPASIDDKAIEKEREEAEESRRKAQEEEERLKRVAQKRLNIRKQGKKSKDAESVGDMRPEEREFATRLKNNALWLRWHSMLERKKDIDRLKEIASKAGIKRISESSDIFDDIFDDITDDEDKSNQSKLSEEEKREAEEILTRLGYIKPDRISLAKTPEARDQRILKAMQSAIGEKGNDLPSDIGESELIAPALDRAGKPQKDRWGRVKTVPSELVKKAREELIKDLSGLDPTDKGADKFRSAFSSVAGKDSYRFSSKKDAGHKLYSDPEDVSNDFVLAIMKMLTKRKVAASKGTAAKWGSLHSDHESLGSGGKEDLKNDDMVSEILRAWRGRIFSLARSAEHEQRIRLSPSGSRPDEVKRRNEVNSRMNKDIRDVKVSLYAKSMLDGGSSESEVSEKLGVPEDQVKLISKDPYASIKFHINYLKALQAGSDKLIKPTNADDKLRLELMKQIVIRASSQSGITLDPDPNKVLESLESYRNLYSSKSRAKPIFAGQAGDEDSGGSDLGKGLEMLAQVRSDDEAPESKGVFSGVSSNPNPQAMAASTERRRNMLHRLYEAISTLSKRSKSGQWQALAVCIKLGLPIDENTGRVMNWTSSELLNNTLDSFFNQKPESKAGEHQWDCFQHIMSIGSAVSFENLHDRLRTISIKLRGPEPAIKGGGDITTRSTRDYLTDGLRFICDYLQDNLTNTGWNRVRTSGS